MRSMQVQQDSKAEAPGKAIDRADRLGILCSCACGLHCSCMPLLIAIIPGLSLLPEGGAGGLTKFAAIISCLLVVRSTVPGFRIHHAWSVVCLAAAAVIIVLGNAFVLSEYCCSEMHTPHPSWQHSWQHSSTCVCGESCAVAPDMCLAAQPAGPPVLTPLIPAVERKAALFSMDSIQNWPAPLAAILLVLTHLLNLHYRKHSRNENPRPQSANRSVLQSVNCCQTSA